ncbi:hypothetical protein ACP70R_002158 [Stipagrostis hirtigluma subsp. patula]
MRSLAAVLFVLAVVAGAASAAQYKVPAPAADVPKGTSPKQIGRFAVLMYSLNRGHNLVFVGVSSSERQPDRGGVRFKLVLTAADAGGHTAPYEAEVWGVPGTFQWVLLKFKRIY